MVMMRTVSLALMCAALVVVVGCGQRLAVMGDSITVVTDAQLGAALAEFNVDTRAELGARVEDMMDEARDAARARPVVAVINLGSNDVLHGHPVEAAAAGLAEMIALFDGATCVVIVNINTHMVRDGIDTGDRAEELNRSIDPLAAADERLHLVDWAGLIRADLDANPPGGTLTDDTVHPTQAGADTLAAAVGSAVSDCPLEDNS
jgi:lysophospholipase L1-like esterase